ncbi:DUF4913 domain-containing protein [Arthrobacter sp.]|uniref:DUF4913 domain-containing protein n=1 Tax=Arthrobacter sp. TaxID=1667 RepID=UPI0035C67809
MGCLLSAANAPNRPLSTWRLNYADPHMRDLMDKDGRFKKCAYDGHKPYAPKVWRRSRTLNLKPASSAEGKGAECQCRSAEGASPSHPSRATSHMPPLWEAGRS